MVKTTTNFLSYLAYALAFVLPPIGATAQSSANPPAQSASSNQLVPVALLDGTYQAGFIPKSESVVLISGTSGRVVNFTFGGQERTIGSFQAPVGVETANVDRTGQVVFIAGFKSDGALAGTLALPSGQLLSSIPKTLMWSQYPSEPQSPHTHQMLALSSEANLALTWIYSKDRVSRFLALVDVATSQVLQTLGTSIGEGSIQHAALSQSGQRLALVQNFQGLRERGLVTIIDLTSGRTLARQEILRAARPRFSPDDQAIVLEAARSEQDLRRQVIYWKYAGKRSEQLWLAVAPTLDGIAIAPEGNQLLAVDGTSLSAWSTINGTELWRIPLQDYSTIVANASGDRLITINRSNTVLWGRGSLNEILASTAADRSGERSYFASQVFSNGIGATKDPQRAEELLNNSVALGHKPAIQMAIRRIERAARNGDQISCPRVIALYDSAKRAAMNVPIRGVFAQCGLKAQK